MTSEIFLIESTSKKIEANGPNGPLRKKIKTKIVDNFEHQGKDVKGGGVTGSNPKGPV